MKKFIKENIVLLICLIVFVFNVASVIQARTEGAAQFKKIEDPARIKTIRGKFSGKTRTSVSIERSSQGGSAQESLITTDEKTRFRGFKNFSEIHYGDIIEAECKESYRVGEDGKEFTTGTVATLVTLIKGNAGGRFTSMGSN